MALKYLDSDNKAVNIARRGIFSAGGVSRSAGKVAKNIESARDLSKKTGEVVGPLASALTGGVTAAGGLLTGSSTAATIASTIGTILGFLI